MFFTRRIAFSKLKRSKFALMQQWRELPDDRLMESEWYLPAQSQKCSQAHHSCTHPLIHLLSTLNTC